jgi:hypothetical protein
MNFPTRSFFILIAIFLSSHSILAGDTEYSGQFEKALVPNIEDFERIVFRFTSNEQVKHLKGLDGPSHTAIGRFFDPRTGKV